MSPKLVILLMALSMSTGMSQECPDGECSTTSALSRAMKMSDNRQPYIPRETQDTDAKAKLDAFRESNKGRKPNFLWFIVDDMGYGDIGGSWGGGGRLGAATPNIDALAAGGLSLMAVYSQPTCTPTRSAMITGRLPARTGLIRPILAGDSITANPRTNESSIASQLSTQGYYTVLTGKWHQGEINGTRPVDVGFDEFEGYYTSQKEITQKFDPRRYPDLAYNEELLASFQSINDRIDLYHHNKTNGETVVEPTTSVKQFAEADQKLAAFTIGKIQEFGKNLDQPFFIAHNFMRCHADNHPSDEFQGQSASKFQYKDNVVEVDAHVGRIMDALREAGVINNTFVFFTSDNGPQMDSWPDSGYTPFRGGKSTAFEGGVRVPGIAYWEGMIQPRISDELFDLMDLYPSMLTMAGVDMEGNLEKLPDMYVDGIDQMSFLLGDGDAQSKREHVYMWCKTDFMALRMREYKYHMKVMLKQSQFQLIDYSIKVDVGLAPWLFNLYVDPKEGLPVGHRRNAWLATMGAEASLHGQTFVKYPMKDIGLS